MYDTIQQHSQRITNHKRRKFVAFVRPCMGLLVAVGQGLGSGSSWMHSELVHGLQANLFEEEIIAPNDIRMLQLQKCLGLWANKSERNGKYERSGEGQGTKTARGFQSTNRLAN